MLLSVMLLKVTRRTTGILVLPFAIACSPLAAQTPAEGASAPLEETFWAQMRAASVSLFDTGRASSVPLSGRTLIRRAGWTKLPEDKTAHNFAGDVVLVNNYLAVVLRRTAPGAELYGHGTKGPALRAVLRPASESGDVKLASVAIVENTPGQAAVDASFTTADGKTLGLRCELGMGRPFVKTEPRAGVKRLCVEAPCRFVVLPDFFADDIVIDATEIPVATAELPSENFLMSMLPDREAIVMSVWNSREQDVRIRLSGSDARRLIRRCEIHYGKQREIWVAALAGRGIWHTREIAPQDAGQVLRLDWESPFAAQWRVDWRRDDGLADSWEMLAEQSDGQFEKPGWFGGAARIPDTRKRWTTVLGSFEYPCWVDRSGRGHLQPLNRVLRFQGPAVIYPINRVQATPLDELTVVDVVRATLGVGPCEYILDVEGQGAAMKGRATCATRDTLNPIYAAGRQKHERATIEKALNDVLAFVTHIRGRIDQYVAFGQGLLEYLDQQKKARPELAEFIAEMEALTERIDASVRRRREKIKTTQYVTELTEKFRRTLLDYEGDDALEKCKAITGAIVIVGGNQDELVGECRMAVKVLRQRAGLAMAVDPRTADIAREIRRRTQKVLRNPATYEAPRH